MTENTKRIAQKKNEKREKENFDIAGLFAPLWRADSTSCVPTLGV